MLISHGFISAIALIALATPAIAQRAPSPWQSVSTRNGDQFYLNVSTVTRKGAIASFDLMQKLKTETKTGTGAIGYQAQANCTHNQIRYEWVTFYDSQMQVQTDQKGEFKWKRVAPGSSGYDVLKRACAIKRR